MTRRCVFTLCVGLLVSAVHAQDPSYYQRQQTWQKTMQSSLENLALQRKREPSLPPVSFGSWSAMGPFISSTRNAFLEVFPPEQEYASETTYGGKAMRWTQKPEWTDGKVILFPQTDYCAMYLSRTVHTSRDTTLSFSLGSDDGIKVWLDGRLLLEHNVERGAAPDQEQLDIMFSRGEHRLQLKISNGQGDFGYYFAVLDLDRRMIQRLVARDFPAKEAAEQMAWEAEDSIWANGWRPGDYAELARRYASATLFDTAPERERAVVAAASVTTASHLETFRERYLASRREDVTPVILTPKPSAEPRIHSPRVFGVRPGSPVLYTIAATGERPMEYSADQLPEGLTLDGANGRITGVLARPGDYRVTLRARNSQGNAAQLVTIRVGENIALTPPLGWNSWNCFASAVDDAKVRSAADAMVSSGLIDHGWTYINIDDCWEIKPGSSDTLLMGEPRTSAGRIRTNKKFPDMKALSAYVHAKGLKLGIYSSPGPLTCAGFTASYQYERQDAEQYAEWGIDYLKYDWCSYGRIEKERTLGAYQKPYRVMRTALDGVKRDILYSLCQYGMGNVWEWGGDVGGNCWRTTGDIEDTWESMSTIGFSQAGHEQFAKPGNWNDPDMLVVGRVGWGAHLHPTRLTPNEQYTHITLWSLLCAPLLIGCDMTAMDEFTYSLLSNDEVLAVNQDPLGRQAARVGVRGDLEVWSKDLEDGSKAVGLFNRGKWKADVAVAWTELGVGGPQLVRDLWRQKDLGTYTGAVQFPVARHGALLLKVTPVSK